MAVCCHLKIFLPWPRDVTTSPLYSALDVSLPLQTPILSGFQCAVTLVVL